MSNIKMDGVKVFSATKARERDLLGETITDWIRSNPDKEIVEKIVTQSSDSEFHCLTITVFYVFGERVKKPMCEMDWCEMDWCELHQGHDGPHDGQAQPKTKRLTFNNGH